MNGYYLIVGRFVPENNYETMISEYMKTNLKQDLVIVSNVERNKFYNLLLKETRFDFDSRIKFVGTVYDRELLKKIREEAFGYIHGHEVGGTNPSLLEALGSTNVNYLYDVGFNKEVGEDAAIYWNKETGNLAMVLEANQFLEKKDIENFGKKAKEIIVKKYSWERICDEYESLFESID